MFDANSEKPIRYQGRLRPARGKCPFATTNCYRFAVSPVSCSAMNRSVTDGIDCAT
jgi:hypothetical protein